MTTPNIFLSCNLALFNDPNRYVFCVGKDNKGREIIQIKEFDFKGIWLNFFGLAEKDEKRLNFIDYFRAWFKWGNFHLGKIQKTLQSQINDIKSYSPLVEKNIEHINQKITSYNQTHPEDTLAHLQVSPKRRAYSKNELFINGFSLPSKTSSGGSVSPITMLPLPTISTPIVENNSTTPLPLPSKTSSGESVSPITTPSLKTVVSNRKTTCSYLIIAITISVIAIAYFGSRFINRGDAIVVSNHNDNAVFSRGELDFLKTLGFSEEMAQIASDVKKAEALTSALYGKVQEEEASSEEIKELIKKINSHHDPYRMQSGFEYAYQSLTVTLTNYEDLQNTLLDLRDKIETSSPSLQIKYKYTRLLREVLKSYPPFYFKEASYEDNLSYLKETLTLSKNIYIIFDYMEVIANEVKGHDSFAKQLAFDLYKELPVDKRGEGDYEQAALEDLLKRILADNMPCFSEDYKKNFEYFLLGFQYFDYGDPYFKQVAHQIPNEEGAKQFAKNLLEIEEFKKYHFFIECKFSAIFEALFTKYPSLKTGLEKDHSNHGNLKDLFLTSSFPKVSV